jgi:ABC-type Fe3+/spermidine/putrescine transport system ATPase subunit
MSTSGSAFVNFIDVQKSYDGETLVVKDLNLAIRRGEFLTLLGPSGSGKTTTLMMLAGFEVPTHGRIELDGQQINDLAPHKRHIGMVFQNYALFPHMTAAKNVVFPLKMRRFPKKDMHSRVERMLELVGLGRFADRYPRELSGGMRMRASIARALVTEPKLLLMDEPFAALDEITRFRLNDDLLALWQALGKTVVFVTHSVFESVYLSQRILVMTPRPGRVSAEVAIEAPYPRDARFRTSADYAGYCRRVSEALASAMGGGHEAHGPANQP